MKRSAGILLYRFRDTNVQFFLVHPGGPFWKNKDEGAWSEPKGEYNTEEDPLQAAIREFNEETGFTLTGRKFIQLQHVKMKSGKVVSVWALEEDFDESKLKSNSFRMEWPPRSGKFSDFPEVDRGAWFNYEVALKKINPAQAKFLDQLLSLLSQ